MTSPAPLRHRSTSRRRQTWRHGRAGSPLPRFRSWRETAEALEALRANEDNVDANSLGEMISGDPLMTLKVLAYESGHRGRRVITSAETVISALVMMGISPFFRAFGPQEAIDDRLRDRPEALEGLQRVLLRAHRGANFALAFAIHRTDPDAAVDPCRRPAARIRGDAALVPRARPRAEGSGDAGRRPDAALERGAASVSSASSSPTCSGRWPRRGGCRR